LHFEIGDVRDYTCDKKFDAVISLFHVASYQTSNNDIKQYFKTAARLLKKGGIFIFDFWYGPAVLTDRPSYRKKVIEDEQTKILRFTTPKMFATRNVCDVHFNVLIIDKSTRLVEEIDETHSMRYFFSPELTYFLQNEGFTIVKEYNWMTFEKLSFNTWNGLIVARLD